MKRTALAVALVVRDAMAQDLPADAPRVVDVHAAHVVAKDGRILEVNGGAWLPDEVLKARAKELVQCRAENDTFRAQASAPPPPGPVLVAVVGGAVVLSLLGGAALGCMVATGSPVCAKAP